MRLVARLVLLSISALLVQGLAFGGSLKCYVLQPPVQALPGVKTIAILDFSGASGRKLSDHLIASLLESGRGIEKIRGGLFSKDREGVTFQIGARTDIFKIVERSRLDQVLKEQSLGVSGIISETQAAALGKVLGVDAIVIGAVTSNTEDVNSREEVTYYVNKQAQKRIVECTTRKASVLASMRLINTSSGEILGTKEGSYSTEAKQCAEERGKLASSDELERICLKTVVQGYLVPYMAPTFRMQEFDMCDIDVDEFEALGDKSIDAFEAGDLDLAYTGFAAIVKQDAYNDAALYNLGVLNEIVGNYDDAQSYLEKAIAIRQESDYRKALDRSKRGAVYSGILSRLGVGIQKHVFATSEDALSKAAATKIRLEGGAGDRIQLRASPEESAPTVAKVPGGIELEVVAEVGVWWKVKTFDGKVGFVNKKDVR
jgi:hypothetical protein